MSMSVADAACRWMQRIVALATAVAGIAATPSGTDDAFSLGQFDRAKVAYTDALSRDPASAEALLGLARVELYENQLDAAARDAARVVALHPNDAGATRVVQTVAERRAVVASAAALDVPDGGVVLPFLESEPLPAIELVVNGTPGTFVLDTGGADVTLDPDFARECGLTIRGGRAGIFLGGKTAEVREAVARRIDAGSISLSQLQVGVLPSRGMHLFAHRTIDGVVGTVFLSRFQSTIDYPRHRLVLRPRAATPLGAAHDTTVPMWLVGDHFIFSEGRVNGLAGQLFSIDSGGTGVGFMPVESTIAAAHVKTFVEKAFQGMGGGGPVRVIPTLADRVCLGDACQHDVHGGYTPGGSPLGIFPFAVAGTVSHEFLKHYAVTFDFVRMQIVLSRND